MPGKPYQSKLNPYLQEIHRLRSQAPPVSYQEIARILHDKHGVAVSPNGIFSFVKARSRKRAVYTISPEFIANTPVPAPPRSKVEEPEPVQRDEPSGGSFFETPTSKPRRKPKYHLSEDF
ncbi:MAG: hypothetical protein JO015_18375 [Verrucomicrobia bacterium]|nr:hypothetical protein [Verrucomicrobiota bacterium]